MADQTVAEPLTLQPQEYLQWLLSLEQAAGFSSGTRAYLVTTESDGRRQLSPVKNGASVVCLEEDLISHLTSGACSTEFYLRLHEHCEQVLAQRDVAIPRERVDLAVRASWEIEATADAACGHLSDDPRSRPLKTLLRRIEALSQAQMSALIDDLSPVEEIREVIGD